MRALEEILLKIIEGVNSTLCYYEKDFVSIQRTPDLLRERCKSLPHYIEARFNYEASKAPELRTAVTLLEGRLFTCTGIDDLNEAKRRFTMAQVDLIDITDLEGEVDDTLKEELTKVRELIGGKRIRFNNVRKKIKYVIE